MKIAAIDKSKCKPECNDCWAAVGGGCKHMSVRAITHFDSARDFGYWDEVRVTVSPTCNGCGDCIDVCPVNAITIQTKSDSPGDKGRNQKTERSIRKTEECPKHYIKPIVT